MQTPTLKAPCYPALNVVASAVLLLALAGCASLSPEDHAIRRAELDQMAETTLTRLVELQPDAARALETCVGFVVLDMKTTKIPVIGTGQGFGVVIDRRNDTRSYVQVSRIEVGGGLGAQSYRLVIMFDDKRLLDRAVSGAWHYEAGSQAGLGTAEVDVSAKKDTKGYTAFKLVSGGAVATVTVRLARARPYLQ